MTYKIRNAKTLHSKSKSHTVEPLDAAGNTWRVISGTSGKHYVVRIQQETRDGQITFAGARCSCPWGQYRPSTQGFRSGCSHAQAVYDHIIANEQGRKVSVWNDLESAKRQHRPMVNVSDGVIFTTRKAPRPAMAAVLYGDDGGGI